MVSYREGAFLLSVSLPDDLNKPLNDLLSGETVDEVVDKLFLEQKPLNPCTRCKKNNALPGYVICDRCKTYANERTESLKKAGYCPRCKSPVDKGVICDNCLTEDKQRREVRKASGKCIRCESLAIPGKTICAKCQSFDKERVSRLKQGGICTVCQVNEAVESKTLCGGCAAKKSANGRKWRASRKVYEQSEAGQLEKKWKASPTDWNVIKSYYYALRGINKPKLIERLVIASFDLIESVDKGLGEFLNVFSFVADLVEASQAQKLPSKKQCLEKALDTPGWAAIATKLTAKVDTPSFVTESLYTLFRTPSGYALRISNIKGYKSSTNAIYKHELELSKAQYISM